MLKNYFFLPISLIIFCSGILNSQNSAIPPGSPDNQLLNGNGLKFTPNEGQIIDMGGNLRPDVLYRGDGHGADIYLRRTGLSYVYTNSDEVMKKVGALAEGLELSGQLKGMSEKQKIKELVEKETLRLHRVDMDFTGCNTTATTINEDESQGYVNFYYAHCPQGITNVKQYNKVTYKNVYNNIDVSYYGTKSSGIKYDIVVQPHGDPSQLKLQWTGAEKMLLDNKGKLHIKTSLNEFEESIPRVYQNINGNVVDVKAEYVLKKANSEQGIANSEKRIVNNGGVSYRVTFKLGTYNPEFPLIIDPWATYFGGSKVENGGGVATDNAGNVVITGATQGGAAFPILTGGGYSQPFAGLSDAFIAKFNSLGQLIWSAYYGGSGGGNVGDGIATDNADNIIITGNTNSASFPVLNPIGSYTQTYMGNQDAFIVKFNSAGVRIWATLYGGSGEEAAFGIVTDPAGDILVTGQTQSTNLPTTPSAGNTVQQPVYGGNTDAFVVKFNAAGALQWGTYCGGSGWETTDGTGAVATDNVGNVFITGSTPSTDFPILTPRGSYSQPYGGGGDVYIVKYNPSGVMQWSSYYGAKNSDLGVGITIDGSGNIVVCGSPGAGGTFPILGPFAQGYSAGFGSFVMKFNNTGALQWATYISTTNCQGGYVVTGGYGNNEIYLCMDVEDKEAANLTNSCDYNPVYNGGSATDPYNPVPPGSLEDQEIFHFSHEGQQLCETFLGGPGEDDTDANGGGGIAIFGNTIYVNGSTDGGYPVTPGAYQTSFGGGFGHNGNGDAFLASICINFCESQVKGLTYTAAPAVTCANIPVTFTPSVAHVCDTTGYQFQWTFTGGNPASSTAVNPVVTYASAGTYPVQLILNTVCASDTILNSSYTVTGPAVTVPAISDITCSTGSVTLNGLCASANTMVWNGGTLPHNASNPAIVTAGGTYTVSATDANGCIGTATAVVAEDTVHPKITATPTDQATCGNSNGTANVSGPVGSAYNYTWSNGGNSSLEGGLAQGTFSVTATDPSNGCTASTSVTIQNSNGPDLSTRGGTTCPGKSEGFVTVTVSGGTPGYTYSWSNGSSTTTTSLHDTLSSLVAGTYDLVVTDAGGCSAATSAMVTSFPKTSVTISRDTTIKPGQSVQLNASGGISCLWSPSESLNTDNSYDPVADPSRTTDYIVTVTDANSCTAITSVLITIAADCDSESVFSSVFMPTAFSPNGDGINDVLYLQTGSASCVTQLKMEIYDRWGELVFETTNPSTGWDGIYKGKIPETSVFVYYLTLSLSNGQSLSKKGNVTLLR